LNSNTTKEAVSMLDSKFDVEAFLKRHFTGFSVVESNTRMTTNSTSIFKKSANVDGRTVNIIMKPTVGIAS
jgi:hypothetical protein